METLWEMPWRGVPASALAVAGLWWIVAAARRAGPGFRTPVTSHAKGLALVRAGRAVLAGGAMVAFAAAWTFHWPLVATLACVIGGEELLEVSVVLAALEAAEREQLWEPRAA